MPEVRSTTPESVESAVATSPQWSFPSPLNGVIIFVVTTLGGFVQVEYGAKNRSPFEEHQMIMWAVSMALSFYAVMLIAEFKVQLHKYNFVSIIKRFTVLMGALVAVLLTIVIMPFFGYFKFLIWIICLVKATIASFQEIYDCFCGGLSQAMEILSSYVRRNHTGLPV